MNDEIIDEVILVHHTNLRNEIRDYIENNSENIKKVKKNCRNMVVEFEMINGSKVYLVPRNEYRMWCVGRTYMLNGNKYISGTFVD